ncbi:MAG: alpha/beta hydrolase [Pseudomonadota bacterium]|nr:alpha/beta hydrolase [Pseudomonadota bacterium]
MKLIPVELRQALPDFNPANPGAVPPLALRYRRFYGLDFEARMPELRVHMGSFKAAGFKLVAQSYLPPQPRGTVFVVHGYYDHVGLYQHLIKALLRRGYGVVAFDLPGHGLSSGSRAAISSFRQYGTVFNRLLQLARQRMPEPWHVVAQSTGGAVVSEYLLAYAGLEERIPFAGVVFYAPLIRPVHWFFNRRLHSLVSPFRDFVARKFSDNSNDPEFARFLREQDPLQPRHLSAKWVGALKQWIPYIEHHQPVQFPLYIIQGKCDETVDWQHNIPQFQRVFPGTQVQYLPKVRHHVVNELELYRRDVFSRTLKYLDGYPGHPQLAIK